MSEGSLPDDGVQMMMLRLCALAALVLTGAGTVVMDDTGPVLTDAVAMPGDGPVGGLPPIDLAPVAPGWHHNAG